ncbi:MAG TPA: response regulator transcription factor [Terriglobales bacterium]|jgi:DNA-binding response OmpR family regulator|nr:response regulator transcription factor [Terriglobales bacterium]
MRILVVEDEKKMAELLRKGLEEELHCVSVVYDGLSAIEFARTSQFDAIVLDVMIPGVDGFEVARRLRRLDDGTPILMLTARDAVPDIARGLDLGVDDYLTKPFSFVELLARLRAITRRGGAPRRSLLKVADLELDPATRRVLRGGHEVHLTATEFRLLEFLMRRTGRAVSRDSIVETVWGNFETVEDNTLEAFISLLRNKIDKGFHHKLIHTIRGVGYSLREEM